MKRNRIDIITMGCSKNLIDSERIKRRLEEKGYEAEHDAEQPSGEYVVVNTCGFISDAKEESIDLILRLISLKEKGEIGEIVVMGCLSERYRKELPEEIPEVDRWYGKFDWKDFIENLPEKRKSDSLKEWERSLTTPPWSAYLKISEGCNRMCAYCAIPLITGRHTSRPMDEILEEAMSLVESGVKEINVIAQDLSSYGTDLYGCHKLGELIDRMAEIPGLEWIRLHYFYPTDFPMEILDVMKRRENVCNYIDIALQHVSDKVLGPMRRKITKQETLKLLEEIRRRVPRVHLRTTLMTGFPGEDEEAFEELLEFVETQKFERLGGFAYSEEEDTYAAKNLEDSISQEKKEKRLERLMELQEEISLAHNETMIGKKIKVLVEGNEGKYALGRSEFDSPEVDQEVWIEDTQAKPGEFIEVEITDCGPYDLKGKQITKTS